ncbi:7120_t:CDS:2 [Funneliformis caledonium]|uniref:7120_t:CDS:1 n=1 Tax=Funneliformis caledonium TaxID=1117310 RepID=A0A9N8ZL69_9GLOM|nr:7120_t:CDS:2 [Funneliformis caledonium]
MPELSDQLWIWASHVSISNLPQFLIGAVFNLVHHMSQINLPQY